MSRNTHQVYLCCLRLEHAQLTIEGVGLCGHWMRMTMRSDPREIFILYAEAAEPNNERFLVCTSTCPHSSAHMLHS